MAATTEDMLNLLEDTAELLKKTQINLRKCPKQRLTHGYIQSRIQCLEEYWKTFNTAHKELAKLTPRDKRGMLPYFVNEEFFIYEDLYLCLLGELRDMLNKCSTKHTTSTEDVSEGSSSQHTLLKLPRITIPTFAGSYDEWPAFKDLFVSLVHDNKSLSQVQKMHYLKDNISGEAAALIKHMHITESNYVKAWDTLKTRYNNKRSIVHALLKRLFAQRKCSIQSASQLKSLLDTTVEILNSLQNLDVNIASWDPLIVFLVVQKLDPESHKDWEKYAYKGESEELATWQDLKTFLTASFRTLERATPCTGTLTREKPKERTFHVSTSANICTVCQENHTLSRCKAFIKLQPSERSEHVKNNRLCFNCLASGHSVFNCRMPMSCRICNRRHHSLLHQTRKTDTSGSLAAIQPTVSTQADVEDRVQVNTMIASFYNAKQEIGLLATAMIAVRSEAGHSSVLKALIDPGSQACFISEKATQLLRLNRRSTNRIVTGMESMKVVVKQEVQVEISSRWEPPFSLPIQAYVMSKHLTTHIPSHLQYMDKWPHLNGLDLADPEYCTPGNIDLLLDVKSYAKILQEGLIKGPPGSPIAQRTSLGWIIFGEIIVKTNARDKCFTMMNENEQIDTKELLKSMWEVETEPKRTLTQMEQLCEDIYKRTHKRDKNGRYIVKLPFNTEHPKSTEGNSLEIAKRRLLQLERRFNKNETLRQDYTKVINEYKELKHIEEVPKQELENKSVYLPHHAVIRSDKETTKTRIVFDASCKDSNGVSLNDELLPGPVLQDDLRNIIMRWRTHAICFVADIEKMYRMIWKDKGDTDFLRVLWRDDPSEEIKHYRLLTVTFGTTSAPYLAVKTLMQLADDEGEKYPEAAKVLREDFYVDDVMSGGDDLKNTINLSKNLKKLLQLGGFELKKWSSNSLEFMETIDPTERSSNAHLELDVNGTIKALGIRWNLGTDKFEYSLNLPPIGDVITKRSILSDIQKLFDPLGWIAPCLVMAKILIQQLWLEKVDWDQALNKILVDKWVTLRDDLQNVNGIYIDRWMGTSSSNKDTLEIHGFSDASIKAFGAVVYCRVRTGEGTFKTKLIAARTRVAPLKTISLPRLELCAAVLLSRLLKQIAQAMRIPMSQVYGWTDSSIVISWLFGDTNKWKTFVANRVVEITSNLNCSQWHHVKTQDNPADIASRGMAVTDLRKCDLWWEGPPFEERYHNISEINK